MSRRPLVAALAAAAAAVAAPASAQMYPLNPLANQTQLAVTLGAGFPRGADATSLEALNVQPRVPIALTGDWHLITRSNLLVANLAVPAPATGVSSVNVSAFLAPSHASPWIWGVGPIVQWSAVDMRRGTSLWSAGPTAALVYANGPWTEGIVLGHRWAVAGTREDMPPSVTQAELLFTYTFASGWYIATNPTISRAWQVAAGESWLVPAGGDVGRTFTIGAHDVSVQVSAYRNVRKTSGSAAWVLGTEISWVR